MRADAPIAAALMALFAFASGARAADQKAEEGAQPTLKVSEQQQSPAPAWPKKEGRRQIDERMLYEYGEQVDAASAVEELLDEVAADIAQIGPGSLSPLIIERVDVGENLDPRYAPVVETRLIAALQRRTGVKVVMCLECRTTQMQVQEGAWRVRQGLATKDDLTRIAQEYGARAMLRGRLSLRRNPDMLALDVQVASTATAGILFAEGYRFDAYNAMLYRGSDAAASREARRQELQDRIDGKPHFGHQVLFGLMSVPAGDAGAPPDSPTHPILGGMGLYRLYETFGVQREFRVGLNVGGFFDTSQVAGGLLAASLHKRIHPINLFAPQVFVGGALGGFLTGGGGNTVFAMADVEVLLGTRIFLHAGVGWVHPFRFAKERDLGGLSPQGGVGFQW